MHMSLRGCNFPLRQHSTVKKEQPPAPSFRHRENLSILQQEFRPPFLPCLLSLFLWTINFTTPSSLTLLLQRHQRGCATPSSPSCGVVSYALRQQHRKPINRRPASDRTSRSTPTTQPKPLPLQKLHEERNRPVQGHSSTAFWAHRLIKPPHNIARVPHSRGDGQLSTRIRSRPTHKSLLSTSQHQPPTMAPSTQRPFFLSGFFNAFRQQPPSSLSSTKPQSPSGTTSTTTTHSYSVSTPSTSPSSRTGHAPSGTAAQAAAAAAAARLQPPRAIPIPQQSRRRGSDSSSEGFREVLGADRMYIGGRTAGGEEKFFKLGVVRRVKSGDRLSLDRMSL